MNHESHEWDEMEKRMVCPSFVSFVFFVVKLCRPVQVPGTLNPEP